MIWKFAAALQAQIRDTLKQVAIELGQWTEKREPTTNGASALTSITVTFVRPSDVLPSGGD